MTPMTWVLFSLGLVLLVAGAEFLVRGASRLASRFGVPPLVVGLTVVAYGTSAPELAVSLQAAAGGGAGVAVGNVVGSNIFNVLVILGLSALLVPLVVDRRLIRREVPLLIGVSVAAALLAWNGRVGRLEGLLLLAGGIAYTAFLVRGALAQPAARNRTDTPTPPTTNAPGRRGATGLDLLRIAAGLAALVVGSRWLVLGATTMARSLGISDLMIGLTVVAAGTSLPELATSIVAGVRGERDIAVGNVVGSNLFNLLVVLGGAAALSPQPIEVPAAALRFDLPVMIGAALACLPIFFTGHRVDRWEGGLFVAYYGLYIIYLWMAEVRHAWLADVRQAVLVFLLPLTAVTLLVLSIRARHRGSAPPTASEGA